MATLYSEDKFNLLLSRVSSHMKLLGLNVLQPDGFPSLLGIVVFIILIFQVSLVVNSIIIFYDSFLALMECLACSLITVQVICRSYFYIRQGSLARDLVQEMRNQWILFDVKGNERMGHLFDRSVNRMTFFYRALYYFYVSTLGIIVIGQIIPDPQKLNLPLTFRIPFLLPDEKALYWYLTYAYHILIILVGIHYVAPLDGVIMLTLIMTSTRIAAVQVLLEELDERIGQVEYQQTSHLEPALDRIIEMHATTKQFVDLLVKSFRLHFFAMIGTICFIICLCLNVIVVKPQNSLYTFLIAAVIQLLVVCLFSSLMLIQNDKLPDTIYGIRWYRMTIPQQKKVKFLLANAQPDMQMTAVFLPVNMSSFVVVLRAAYSYFTLLNNH